MMKTYTEQNFGYLQAIGYSLGWGIIFALFFLVAVPIGALILASLEMKPTIENLFMANGSLGSLIAVWMYLFICYEIYTERKQLAVGRHNAY